MSSLIFFDQESAKRGYALRIAGDIIGVSDEKYDLDEHIDRGGNATIFRAQSRSTAENVAIKFLLNTSHKLRARFQREISLMGKINEEHFIKMFDHGTVTVVDRDKKRKKVPFVVMELADCNLLGLLSSKRDKISYEIYASQFRGLTKALSELHKHASHRDIKPENILVANDRWILADCGLCTAVSEEEPGDLTGETRNIGPKFWLSPEAHNRRLGCQDVINEASDVFQLAAVFWLVETGRQPCGIITKEDWSGPEKLFELLYRALYHNSNKRPKNGEEFYNELCDALVS